jgi:hypothetical protein
LKTSQYPTDTRKNWKFDQRTDAYRDLQQRSAEARRHLEQKLREQKETIARLKQRLVESGVPLEEVAKLAA